MTNQNVASANAMVVMMNMGTACEMNQWLTSW